MTPAEATRLREDLERCRYALKLAEFQRAKAQDERFLWGLVALVGWFVAVVMVVL